MDNSHVVAMGDNADNYTDDRCRVILGVTSLLHDGVEELPTVADVHGKAYIALVVVDPADAHNVGVTRKVVHDLHLAAYIVDLLGAAQLTLGDHLRARCEAVVLWATEFWMAG